MEVGVDSVSVCMLRGWCGNWIKGTQQPWKEVTEWSVGYVREGWAVVMKGGGQCECKPMYKSFSFATSLEAIFLFFLRTGMDRSLTQIFHLHLLFSNVRGKIQWVRRLFSPPGEGLLQNQG